MIQSAPSHAVLPFSVVARPVLCLFDEDEVGSLKVLGDAGTLLREV